MTKAIKKVVYGCITGGYDNIPTHKYIAPDWDYILFTDDKELVKQGRFAHWTIKPLAFDKLSNVKNARWHKVNAHKLFPEYDYSLWLDSNIIINDDGLFNLANDLIKQKILVAVPNHPERVCIYDEAEIIKEYRIDTPRIVDKEMQILRHDKYPKNNGLSETGILLRRHNDMKSTLDLWWSMIEKYSKRDQLSFNYALWKTNVERTPIYSGPYGFGIHRQNDTFSFVYQQGHGQDKCRKVIDDKKFYIPLWLARIICLFVFSHEARRKFRHKYVKPNKDKKNTIIPQQTDIPLCLVYTCANEPYFPFAILYPLFILLTNKNVAIEIAIDNYDKFIAEYGYLLSWYERNFPNQVYFHPFTKKYKVKFGTLRFITTPLWRGKYVYIGDIDIMITESIIEPHLANIKKNKLDFSNIKRKDCLKLSGLHFIEYDKMYPVKIPHGVNLLQTWDEDILYLMMKNKGYKIPDENTCTFRPLLGIHFSFYSRPPLPTLTTKDKIVTEFPSWFSNSTNFINNESGISVEKYLKLRYSPKVKDFMTHINPLHIRLRKIIQYMDMSCWYYKNQDKLKI